MVFVRNGQQEALRGAENVILAMGARALDELSASIKDKVDEVHVIGDAKEPQRVLQATAAAAEVGRKI